MQARMKNPAMIITEAMQPIQGLMAATQKGGVEPRTLGLVHLRASQINGCSACVESGVQRAKQGGDTDERLIAVAAWRAPPRFPNPTPPAPSLPECLPHLTHRPD